MEFGLNFFPSHSDKVKPYAQYWRECMKLVEVGDAAGEDFLADLVDGLEGAEAPAEFQKQKLAKVLMEVRRGVPIAFPQA